MLKPLNAVRNLKDPIKQFCCNMSIVFPAGSQLNQYIDGEELILRTTTYSLPKITGDRTQVFLSGFERNYAGKQTRAGTFNMSVVEVWDAKITEIFKVWCNAYHNYKDGKIALLDQYTGIVNINLVDPDVYEPQPAGIKKYDLRLFDVFPNEVNFPQIDASSSEAVNIDVSLNYNYFLMGDEIDGQ